MFKSSKKLKNSLSFSLTRSASVIIFLRLMPPKFNLFINFFSLLSPKPLILPIAKLSGTLLLVLTTLLFPVPVFLVFGLALLLMMLFPIPMFLVLGLLTTLLTTLLPVPVFLVFGLVIGPCPPGKGTPPPSFL